MNYFFYIIIITIFFIVYIEYSLGGILLRPNSTGKNIINIKSLMSYLVNPLHNKFLWNIKLLDVNYVFVLFISLIVYYKFE